MWRRTVLVAWVMTAVLLQFRGYEPLADLLGWPKWRVHAMTQGIASIMLYAAIPAMMFVRMRSVALAGVMLAACGYALAESVQVAVCQGLYAAHAEVKYQPGQAMCDALLGWPVDAATAAAALLLLSLVLFFSVDRIAAAGDTYDPRYCYVGYTGARNREVSWLQALAGLLCWPFGGKVLIVHGEVWRARRGRGWVLDSGASPHGYILRRIDCSHRLSADLRAGVAWSLRRNCVTAGTLLWR